MVAVMTTTMMMIPRATRRIADATSVIPPGALNGEVQGLVPAATIAVFVIVTAEGAKTTNNSVAMGCRGRALHVHAGCVTETTAAAVSPSRVRVRSVVVQR